MIPEIQLKGLSIKDLEHVLDSKNIKAATASTVNKLASAGTTAVKRAISGKYVIKQKDLSAKGTSNRNGLSIRKAKNQNTIAFIIGSGHSLPVANFRISPKSPEAFRSRKRGKGVTYTVQKGKKVRVKKAFVAKMKSGHIGAFVRKGKLRTPIRELMGPSIPQMLEENNSMQSVNDVITKKGPSTYQNELQHRLRRLFK